VEATSPSSDRPIVADRAIDQQPEMHADASRQGQPTAELRRLMDLADRYARQLVTAADAPPGVLLLVHGSDLDVVAFDGPHADVRALPRLLARRRPSSAALVVAARGALGGTDGDLVLVVGETSDGLRDERRFRVRACGRTRRLTRLPDRAARGAPGAALRLFPPPVLQQATEIIQ
jgi:hypothetical protein